MDMETEKNTKRVLHVCNHCGCTALTSGRFCEKHKKLYERSRDTRRSAYKRGYDGRWRKARLLYLASHPFCVECLRNGIHSPATDVDHVIPHKGDKRLFWDKDNWQALCHSCHSRKTRLKDMGTW